MSVAESVGAGVVGDLAPAFQKYVVAPIANNPIPLKKMIRLA
jgi:hypothetical protein